MLTALRRYAYRGPWATALAAVVAMIITYPIARRGIVLSDEGYLLMQSLDMLSGKILYRDLDAFVMPGMWFSLAGLFAVVEPTVFAARMLALAGFGCIVAAVYRITANTTDLGHAFVAIVAMVTAMVWAFPGWTYSFYSPFSTLFALVGLERVLAWSKFELRRDLFLAGLAIGLSILFKQNYGVFAMLGGLAAYLIFALGRTDRRFGALVVGDAVAVLLGGLALAVPFLAYLFYHGVFDAAYHALVVQPFSDFTEHHAIRYLGPSDMLGSTSLEGSARLTYGSYPLSHAPSVRTSSQETILFNKRLHVFMYLWPPMIFVAAAAWLGFARRAGGRIVRETAAILAFTATFFLGVFPRADSNHLMQVYQPVILLSAVVFHRLRMAAGSAWLRIVVSAVGCAILGCYAYFGAVWYLDLISHQRTPLIGRGGGVLVDEYTGGMINRELELLGELSDKDDPVLSGPGLAMLNFLADRQIPGRYYNLYAVHIGHDEGSGVVDAARAAGVDTAVIEYNNFYSDPDGMRDVAPILAGYLRNEFEITHSIGQNQHAILQRRSAPISVRSSLDLLERCNSSRKLIDGRMIREHTMFRSLYLSAPIISASGNPNVLRCEADIPPDARLRFLLDFTRPREIEDGALLYREVTIRPLDADEDDAGEVVFSEAIVPEPAPGWVLPGPRAVEVDLSAYAGRSAEIQLRTWAEGEIRHHPFTMLGLTSVWMNPTIEQRGD